jgi:hypothetical protein
MPRAKAQKKHRTVPQNRDGGRTEPQPIGRRKGKSQTNKSRTTTGETNNQRDLSAEIKMLLTRPAGKENRGKGRMPGSGAAGSRNRNQAPPIEEPVEKLAERQPKTALIGRHNIVLPTVSYFLRRLRSSPQFAVI